VRPRLLFAHGWALDRTLWDRVLAELGPAADGAVLLDAGYYGRPTDHNLLSEAPVLGVGQSLGVLELLTAPPAPLAGLVAIDGFARFAAGPDFPEGQHAAGLKAMARRLRASPEVVLGAFITKALDGSLGDAPPPCGAPDRDVLGQGLERLLALDGRAAAQRVPIWRLHASSDPVAPLAMADAAFTHANVRARRVREGADHLSPLTAPRACADLIRDALQALET
jgi:pimeloyl-[acyl-carrier protein] methyl ester esterase